MSKFCIPAFIFYTLEKVSIEHKDVSNGIKSHPVRDSPNKSGRKL